MRLIPAFVPVFCLLAAGCETTSEPETPPFDPVADTALLMSAIVEPQAEIIWDSVGSEVDDRGITEFKPTTAEEWDAVRSAAVNLAESGNLLLIGPRARADEGWTSVALALVETARSAMRAAEAQDPDQLFDAGGQIYAVCGNCHQKYWPDAPARVE